MLTSETRSHAFTELHSTSTNDWEVRHAAATDVGRQRAINEDFFMLYPDRELFVVADGMGGHAAGEVASRIAAETLAAYFDEYDLPNHLEGDDEGLAHHLVQAIKIANAAIYEEATERVERQGMGTTLVALTIADDRAWWAHVGDSRIYRLRGDDLIACTRDHSLLEQTLRRHNLSDEEADRLQERFPYKNVITRAVGSRYVVDVPIDSAPLSSGDLFVLTTDGIHDVIDDGRLAELLIDHRDDWHAACQAVVAEANQTGGPDNITIACIEARRR